MLSGLAKYVSGSSEFKRNTNSFKKYLANLRELEKKPNEVAALNKIEDLFNQINVQANEIFSRYDSSSLKKAVKIVDDLEHQVFNVLEETLDKSSMEERNDANRSLDILNDDLSNLILISSGVTLVAMIIAIMIAYLISNSITRRTEN
ncbi:hypothetical protein HR060_18780 [Catenovulum sp. SM1970]|uniref:hypothetical protein n=1 Tax=Marinifaba aquimaris TaxID=2741323 RepID=UPI00157485A3|nr:hypothetical protein [Marinifaba aquimaris]NTS78891.1 hypothetical protein [Marinifaba aquimaris]